MLETYRQRQIGRGLYDHVLVPALGLFEQDRHRNALDQETVNFITETVQEQVEELGLRPEEAQPAHPPIETVPNESADERGQSNLRRPPE